MTKCPNGRQLFRAHTSHYNKKQRHRGSDRGSIVGISHQTTLAIRPTVSVYLQDTMPARECSNCQYHYHNGHLHNHSRYVYHRSHSPKSQAKLWKLLKADPTNCLHGCEHTVYIVFYCRNSQLVMDCRHVSGSGRMKQYCSLVSPPATCQRAKSPAFFTDYVIVIAVSSCLSSTRCFAVGVMSSEFRES